MDEISQWLRDKAIQFTDMLKVELYNLIKMHKPTFEIYEVDKILQEEGHTVLRLPPYHPDLYPIGITQTICR